jgi:hypothetical protein
VSGTMAHATVRPTHNRRRIAESVLAAGESRVKGATGDETGPVSCGPLPLAVMWIRTRTLFEQSCFVCIVRTAA